MTPVAGGLAASSQERRIVMVMGPGRSGTSTMAGALVRCGLQVPGRAIRGNPTNPSGFYEPRWVVDFHRRLLDRWHVEVLDTSPGARRSVAKAVSRHPEIRSELRAWLAGQLGTQPRLVVKDPRGIWFHDLWVDVMRELEVEPGFVTMLRHPVEVSASRHKSYKNTDEPPTRDVQVRRVAGWVNAVLTAEEMTRGSLRTWIHYSDLLSDWRSALTRVSHELDLSYEPAVDANAHPVDDFIDPTLRSVSSDSPKLDLPGELQDLADEVWETVSRVAASGDSAASSQRLDQLRQRYRGLTDDAAALIHDGSNRRRQQAKARAHRRGVQEGLTQANPSAPEPSLWRKLLKRVTRTKG